MSLAELKEGLAFQRKILKPSHEEKGFIDDLELPEHHEGIRLDRLVILPACQNAIFPVLERHIDKEDSAPVIEVGCGTGSFSYDLAPDWLRNRIVSFDLNSPSLRLLTHNDDRAQVFKGSSYEMPIKDQTVSTVIGYSSFDSMLFLELALRETKRILEPGGKLILFQDLTTDLYESTEEGNTTSVEHYHEILIDEAEKVGFSILEGRKDYLSGESVETIQAIKGRVPDFDLDERPFPIVTVWDRGYLYHPGRAGNKERKEISKREIMADLTQAYQRMQEEGILDEFNAKGGDLIALLSMRYLVLQKPLE